MSEPKEGSSPYRDAIAQTLKEVRSSEVYEYNLDDLDSPGKKVDMRPRAKEILESHKQTDVYKLAESRKRGVGEEKDEKVLKYTGAIEKFVPDLFNKIQSHSDNYDGLDLDIPNEYIEPALNRWIEDEALSNPDFRSGSGEMLTELLVYISKTRGKTEMSLRVYSNLDGVGSYLPSPCTLNLEGDCGIELGAGLNGGNIIFRGNCGQSTGRDMKDGTLTIEGDCGRYTGLNMEGGTLIVNGKVSGWFPPPSSPFQSKNKGKIVHNGAVLWDNGPTPDTPEE